MNHNKKNKNNTSLKGNYTKSYHLNLRQLHLKISLALVSLMCLYDEYYVHRRLIIQTKIPLLGGAENKLRTGTMESDDERLKKGQRGGGRQQSIVTSGIDAYQKLNFTGRAVPKIVPTHNSRG